MISIKDEIRKVFDRGSQAYDWIMEKGDTAQEALTIFMIRLTIVIFIDILLSWLLGWFGFGKLNLVAVIILLPFLIGIMISPEIIVPLIAGAIASGAAQNPETIKGELKVFLNGYIKACKNVIFWLLLLALALAFFPIYKSLFGFLGLILIISLTVLCADLWGFEATWGKKLIYWSMIFSIGLFLAGFMPDVVYTKIIGTTPSAMFGITEDEEALISYERAAEEKAVEKRVEKLEELMEKVEDGETLTEKEQKELEKTRAEIRRRSLPAIGGKALDKTGEAVETSASWWSNVFGKSGGSEKSDDSDDSDELDKPRLVEIVKINQSIFSTSLRQLLPIGRYSFSFDPVEASSGAKFMVQTPDGSHILRDIKNNSATIRRGEYICGILTKTDPVTVQIFEN